MSARRSPRAGLSLAATQRLDDEAPPSWQFWWDEEAKFEVVHADLPYCMTATCFHCDWKVATFITEENYTDHPADWIWTHIPSGYVTCEANEKYWSNNKAGYKGLMARPNGDTAHLHRLTSAQVQDHVPEQHEPHPDSVETLLQYLFDAYAKVRLQIKERFTH